MSFEELMIAQAAKKIVDAMSFDNDYDFEPTDEQFAELGQALTEFKDEYEEAGYGELDDALLTDLGCGMLYVGLENDGPYRYDPDPKVDDHVPWDGAKCQAWKRLDKAINDIFGF